MEMAEAIPITYRLETPDIPAWAWGVGIVSVVSVGGFLLYQYFIRPQDVILDQYQAIMEDIYAETKDFLIANEAEGIYGLNAEQQAIINAKNDALEKIRPDVEYILRERGLDVNAWVIAGILGIVGYYAFKEALPYLKDRLTQWRKEDAASNIQSARGHGHLLFEVVTNDFAYAGRTNIASGFLSTMQQYYQAYTGTALQVGINYYQALLLTLIPGTMAYLVASNMLSYMAYEISAVTGIMGSLWNFWLPII